MPEIDLPYPLRGLSDNFAHDAQPPLTTRDAQNERSVDPVTNRVRGGQRAGFSKFSQTALGAGPVRAVAQVTYDGRQTTYEHTASSTPGDLSEWSTALESGETCSAVAHDSQGAKYVIDGKATLGKYNRDGVRVYTFALPVLDENHIVRALALDDFDRIYVGVSEGGSQGGAWIRCYVPNEEKNLVLLWQRKPDAYVEQIVVRDDKLYVAMNDVNAARSRYVVYENVTLGSGPTVAFQRGAPYPINGIDVNDKGEVFTAHEPRTGTAPDKRYYDPRVASHTAIYDEQRWNPTMLPHWERRKWEWFRAEDLDLEDGDEVLEWRSLLGRGITRLFKDGRTPASGGSGTSTEYFGPRYKAHGLGYKPSVQFDGNFYRLITNGSIGNTKSANEFQPTLFPNRKGYAIVMVVQVADDSTKQGRLWSQENDGASGPRACYVNTAAAASPPGAGLAGAISITDDPVAGPTGDETDPSASGSNGYFTNGVSAAIITVVCDNNSLHADYQRSVLRVNGATVARWRGRNFFTDSGTISAIGCVDNGDYGPIVGISEIFILQSYADPDDSDKEKVCTFPDVDATADYVGTHDDTVSDTEIERIEGFFAWDHGISHLLDDGANGAAGIVWGASGPSSKILQPFTSSATADGASDPTLAPPNPNGRGADTIDATLLSDGPLTAKWTAQRGNPRWANSGGGMGYAVKVGDGTSIFTAGPRTGTAGFNGTQVRRINDAASGPTGSWGYFVRDGSGATLDYAYTHPRLAVDEFNNVWAPFNCPSAAQRYTLVGLAGDPPSPYVPSVGQVPFLQYAVNATNPRAGRAVSIDPRYPDYVDNPTTITRPEFVALACEANVAASTTLHQVRLVNGTPNGLPARIVKYVGVVNGSIVVFEQGVPPVTAATGALSGASKYISAVNAFGRVFFSDGINYRYYEPRDGTVSRWNAEDGGGIVPRYKLLTTWRGRMVLARGDDDPQNWQMSEAGNPFGWNFFPADSPLATQAIIGNEAEIGRVPDVITALIPYDRERLIFGCDHTIYVMWGDPMENGSIVLASDITGMAFGSSWAKDADGMIYFFGSRGGVYTMAPGSGVRKLSDETIDRRLQDIDMDAFFPTLVWDEDLRELRVFMCAKTTGTVTPAHWAWCKRTKSWHQDKFSAAAVQPTCATVFDSDDPEDRVVVIGCEDGYVRKVDRDAASDDGRTIDSWVTIGPFADPSGAIRLRDPRIVLASEQGGCRVEMGSADSADASFTAQHASELRPGDNGRRLFGVRGSYAFLRLRNAAPGNRWAYEKGRIGVYSAGRRVARDG